MSIRTVLHLFRSHPSTTLSSVSQKPDPLLTTNLDFKSIPQNLASSFSCHLWSVGCIAYHIWVWGEYLDPPTPPRPQGGKWQVGDLFEMGVCFSHQPPLWERDQGKSRSSNPKSLWLTSDKLWFPLPQRAVIIKLRKWERVWNLVSLKVCL